VHCIGSWPHAPKEYGNDERGNLTATIRNRPSRLGAHCIAHHPAQQVQDKARAFSDDHQQEDARLTNVSDLVRLFRGPERGSLRREAIEMDSDLIEMHDVDILMMKVEKVDLVNQLGPVERALLDD
jgi:hypothetical protein